jgi:hypothetical protein
MAAFHSLVLGLASVGRKDFTILPIQDYTSGAAPLANGRG